MGMIPEREPRLPKRPFNLALTPSRPPRKVSHATPEESPLYSPCPPRRCGRAHARRSAVAQRASSRRLAYGLGWCGNLPTCGREEVP